ncbi:MAG: dephospho-CoA kinase [Gammaproteobacteria bacterium]|nr:dephospho-CoA kinase [Gammaproteobacteria bacterium]
MLIIGLTGGIGSGKSTVAQLFSEYGIPVLDADQIARQLVEVGQPALTKIAQRFGQHILHADGSLNRSALRQKIFNDSRAKQQLENLLHPLIRQQMHIQSKQLLQQQPPPSYCIHMIPLLLESQQTASVDRILVVDLPEQLQIQRVKQRDQQSQTEVQRIIEQQVSRQQRLQAANEVIDNSGHLNALQKQVKQLHQHYVQQIPSADSCQ